MNRIASEILKVAADLMPRIRATFEKGEDVEDRVLNSIHFDIQRFVVTLRKNEELTCLVSRQDDDKTMEITIGFTDHEAMKGIVDSLKEMLEKMERKTGVKVKIETLGKN